MNSMTTETGEWMLRNPPATRSSTHVEKSITQPAYQRLCQQIRHLRRAAGLSQAELARRIDESPTFVSEIERGARRVDILELRTILDAIATPAATAAVAVLDAVHAVLDRVAPEGDQAD